MNGCVFGSGKSVFISGSQSDLTCHVVNTTLYITLHSPVGFCFGAAPANVILATGLFNHDMVFQGSQTARPENVFSSETIGRGRSQGIEFKSRMTSDGARIQELRQKLVLESMVMACTGTTTRSPYSCSFRRLPRIWKARIQ